MRTPGSVQSLPPAADCIETRPATGAVRWSGLTTGPENPSDLAIHLSRLARVLLFQRPGWAEEAYAAWSNALAKKGVILFVPTTWHGRAVLRLAFVNPDTQAACVIEVLDTLR